MEQNQKASIHSIGVSTERTKSETEIIFEGMMAGDLPTMKKNPTYISEKLRKLPNKINTKKPTLIHNNYTFENETQ